MELVGTNDDSSGIYRMYRDGDVLVTHAGADESTLFELARQPLIAAPDYSARTEDDWYRYGTNGHECDIHFEDPYARLDGRVFELGTDQGEEPDTSASSSRLGVA